MEMETERLMRKTLLITKALADGNRLRIVMALMQKPELCVCQITELLKLATPTVSRHMSILQGAGLVGSRKDGRWVYYALDKKVNRTTLKPVLKWLHSQLKSDPTILRDQMQLEQITSCDVADLCIKQKKPEMGIKSGLRL